MFKKQHESSTQNEFLALWYDCKLHLDPNHVAKEFKNKSPTNLNRIRPEQNQTVKDQNSPKDFYMSIKIYK